MKNLNKMKNLDFLKTNHNQNIIMIFFLNSSFKGKTQKAKEDKLKNLQTTEDLWQCSLATGPHNIL